MTASIWSARSPARASALAAASCASCGACREKRWCNVSGSMAKTSSRESSARNRACMPLSCCRTARVTARERGVSRSNHSEAAKASQHSPFVYRRSGTATPVAATNIRLHSPPAGYPVRGAMQLWPGWQLVADGRVQGTIYSQGRPVARTGLSFTVASFLTASAAPGAHQQDGGNRGSQDKKYANQQLVDGDAATHRSGDQHRGNQHAACSQCCPHGRRVHPAVESTQPQQTQGACQRD